MDQQERAFDQIVDDSHKYVTVYHDGYVGPGNAHHHYAVKTKDGIELLRLQFQDGPIQEAGVNGVMNEDLMAMVIDRLRGFQSSQFACRENAIALTKLEESLMWLKSRTQKREVRGVEGTHKV